jgi:hypothetical protein
MGERMGRTEPFNSGQQTNAKQSGEKVPVKFKMSKVRNAGQPDPLAQALVKPPPIAPTDMHKFAHSKTSRAGGAHYNPAGEFGRPTGRMMSKATNPGGKKPSGTFRGHP